MSQLLDRINTPSDIKSLNMDELRQLCAEIRSYMVEVCSDNPGHLASSLGAVELIVGVHYVYDTPDDKFVIDVGHQGYAHKILTGRREEFRTLREKGGISGFPNMKESKWDAFGVGHSSTSISAALGYAEAARILGNGAKSVALIGDGALTGGLAYEAMNNAGVSKSDLLILLNDNNQSIDKAVGGVHKHLLHITTSESYNSLKNRAWDIIGDNCFRGFLQRWIRSLKSWIVKSRGGDLFEAIGLRYFGPIDGNDIEQVVLTLKKLRELKGPRVLHCITTKGKGYAPAEKDPMIWHAPGRFDPATGERKVSKCPVPRYQDVFGEVLCDLAEKNPDVIDPEGKIIYLSFDDGPGPYTDRLLDILERYNVKASFFVTGLEPDYADCIGRAFREGHSIGVHTCSHNYKQIYAGADAYWSDFEQEQAIIQQQTGYRSELMRFPGGSSNTVSKGAKGLMTELTQEAGEKGYTYVDWNAVSGDAERGNTKDSILAGLKNSTLQSGSNTVVMLCHDLNANTVSVIESYLNWGQANGYHFLPMSPASSGAHHSVNN